MNKLLYVIVLLAFQLQTFGQESQILKGVVQDSKTGDPIAFASVGLLGKPLSTVTNLDGQFAFNIPLELAADSVTISSIGYDLRTTAITAFKDDVVLLVELVPSETLLDVVTVMDSLSGNEIMQLAAQKMETNHPNNPTSMKVFYRERQLLDGAYVSLVEAALTIYDEFNIKKRKSPLRTKVKVDELRRSLVYEHPFNSWWQQDNLMMHSWMLNPIPYSSRTIAKSAKNNEFKRVSKTTVLGQSAFVVETNNEDFWKTTYYVQTGSYAVVRVEENFDEAIDGPKHWAMQGDSLLLDVHFKKRYVLVDFKKINNIYYPTFMRLNASHEYYQKDTFLAQFGIIQDFVINDINSENPTVIARNEAARIGKSLISENYNYNEEFWESYNVLQETPLEKKLIEDLQSKLPLQEQFTIKIKEFK